MARGNQGRSIFGDDQDRQRFLETLGEAHAYVLMGNHDHLLVEAPEGNLVVGMKWLRGTHYSRVTQAVSRMNRKPGRKLEKLKRRLMETEERNK